MVFKKPELISNTTCCTTQKNPCKHSSHFLCRSENWSSAQFNPHFNATTGLLSKTKSILFSAGSPDEGVIDPEWLFLRPLSSYDNYHLMFRRCWSHSLTADTSSWFGYFTPPGRHCSTRPALIPAALIPHCHVLLRQL